MEFGRRRLGEQESRSLRARIAAARLLSGNAQRSVRHLSSWVALPLIVACGGNEANDASANGITAGRASLPPSCTPIVGQPSSFLLDDFEDGNNQLLPLTDRHGLWYANNDGSGSQLPLPDPARQLPFPLTTPGSPSSPRYSLHSTGEGFEAWGAFISVDLNESTHSRCTYDVTPYAGLRFNARGSQSFRVSVGTLDTTPIVDGGRCTSELCGDYGMDIQLEADWTSVSVPFSQIALPPWATIAAFVPTEVVRLTFWAERRDFDFWIDDVSFY